MTKYGWFDFATSRPSLSSLLKTVREDGSGTPSVAPVRPRGGDGQVTVAEKKASVAGQQARGTLGAAGSRDKCKKGKSCGAACIDAREDCIIDFDVDINTALNNNRRYIQKLRESGNITKEEADGLQKTIEDPKQFKRAGDRTKAFKEFGQMMREGRVTDDEKDFVARLLLSTTLVPGQDRNAARVLKFDEIESILKLGRLDSMESAYQASFVNGKFDPSAKGGMGQQIDKLLTHKISDEVAEKAYYMLPSKARAAIDKAGAVTTMFAGYDQNGNVVYADKPTKERGIFLTKRWGEQGGLDPYTGKPIDIRNAEPEHMVAYAHAKDKGGGGGDQPKNLMWSATQPNNNKAGAGDNFVKWKEKLEANLSKGKERYDREDLRPAQEKENLTKGRAASATTDLRTALDAASSQQRANTMKALMLAYGDNFRYLLRAADVGWQHKDRDLDHRKKGKPAFMDMDIPKLPGYKVKPSMAVMVALSVVEPNQRKALLGAIEDLRLKRMFSDAEAELVRGNNDARLDLKRQKSAEYANKLVKTLEQFVPDLNVML